MLSHCPLSRHCEGAFSVAASCEMTRLEGGVEESRRKGHLHCDC